jgi:hypothetical protein
MDNVVLRKRLSSFRTKKGSYTRVSDDLLVDILRAWESWAGSSKEFYQSLGVRKGQLAPMIKKGKKLSKKGNYGSGEFKELKLESLVGAPSGMPIEISWENGKVIRFSQVEALVDFLKKVA